MERTSRVRCASLLVDAVDQLRRRPHERTRPVGPAGGRSAGPPRAHLLDRGPRSRHRRDGGGRAEPLVLGRQHGHVGRGRRGRGGHPVLRGSVLRAPGPAPHAGRQERPPGPGCAAGRRRPARRAPGGHARRARRGQDAHRRQVHPGRGRPVRQAVRGAGQPDGEGHGLAGHGAGLRGHAGRPGRPAAGGPRRGRGRGRRHPWAAVGRHHRGQGDGQRPAVGRPGLRPARRGPPGAAAGAAPAGRRAARLQPHDGRRRLHGRGGLGLRRARVRGGRAAPAAERRDGLLAPRLALRQCEAAWHAVALATNGRLEPARPLFKKAFDADPRWRELVKRLPGVDQLPKDPKLVEAILAIR
jgi:hypothetical protein